MLPLLHRILVVLLVMSTCAVSSAAVTCAVECGHESDAVGELRRTDNCCSDNQPPHSDSRDERSGDGHGPCLSVHCQSVLLAGVESVAVITFAPARGDLLGLIDIPRPLNHERIFHPPRG